MLSHETIWKAIDTLAERHQLTASGLARRAGLDPTSFNKSKRHGPDGRVRWPSTESIAKVLEATGATLDQFVGYLPQAEHAGSGAAARTNGQAPQNSGGRAGGYSDRQPSLHSGDDANDAANGLPEGIFPPQSSAIPLLGFAQAGAGGFFDDGGFPAGQGWDVVDFPIAASRKAGVYALEVQGESMLPLYRDGDRLIVEPGAQLRRGDRVVVKTRDGEVMAKILLRHSARSIELTSLNPDHPNRVFERVDVEWMARIIWASQ